MQTVKIAETLTMRKEEKRGEERRGEERRGGELLSENTHHADSYSVRVIGTAT
jgi:hypothetical protein